VELDTRKKSIYCEPPTVFDPDTYIATSDDPVILLNELDNLLNDPVNILNELDTKLNELDTVFDDVAKVSNQVRDPEYPLNDPVIEPVKLPLSIVVLPDKTADDVTSKISKLPVFT
jgi:hypothetical protein